MEEKDIVNDFIEVDPCTQDYEKKVKSKYPKAKWVAVYRENPWTSGISRTRIEIRRPFLFFFNIYMGSSWEDAWMEIVKKEVLKTYPKPVVMSNPNYYQVFKESLDLREISALSLTECTAWESALLSIEKNRING